MSSRLWLLRVAWITLPLSTGAAASDAIASFDEAARWVGAGLLFASWGAGAVAVLAPRPVGLTLLRATAPAYALLAIAALVANETDGLEGWGAVAITIVTAVLTSMPDIARAAANGIAYGNEERFPLRVPPALFIGPLPIVRVAVVVGAAAGPLLLADGEIAWGIVALVLGLPALVFGARALHGLSRRWLVLVPAGVVVVDPMTLAEPVLFVRRQVRTLHAADVTVPIPGDAADLRLGASLGNVLMDLAEPVELTRIARGRRGTIATRATQLLVAVGSRRSFLETAARRGVTASRAR
ncbi:MAG: hypothetical protein WD598_02035 [Acidimicrobiia bacterium]